MVNEYWISLSRSKTQDMDIKSVSFRLKCISINLNFYYLVLGWWTYMPYFAVKKDRRLLSFHQRQEEETI